MIDNRTKRCQARRGVALLMVLILIMAITVVSLGFISRCDVELACGRNMLLRSQMDYLADSGLEHAKGLILHPQEVASEYWTGATDQKLINGSNDYYDVTVERVDPTDRCTYQITCDAYRVNDGQEIGHSRLLAELRLDPCLGLWAGADTVLRADWALDGDVYCAGTLTNRSTIDGDVFSAALAGPGSITGSAQGTADLALAWPLTDVTDTVAHFTSRYGIYTLAGTLGNLTYGPSDPIRVAYRNGDLVLNSNVTVDGMLLVDGSLTVRGNGNRITAGKNVPALYVTGDLVIEDVDGLSIEGLVIVDGRVGINAAASNIGFLGALFARRLLTETALDAASSLAGQSGFLYGAPTWRPAGGQSGGALEFDGLDDYMQTPDSDKDLQLSGDYTLSVRLKPAAAQKAWAGIVCESNPDGTRNHWALQFYSDALREIVVCHDTAKWLTGIALGDIDDGVWHHVAVVRKLDGSMTSYLDGIQRKTIDPNDPFKSEGPRSGMGHLNIGADRTALAEYLYAGLIDEVRIYDRALTVGEIQTPPDDLSLEGYWKLDESGSEMAIAAAPARSAIVVWPASGQERHWSPAAGAFFRSVRRN